MSNPFYVLIVICVLLGLIVLLMTSGKRRAEKKLVAQQAWRLIWRSLLSVSIGWLVGLFWFVICCLALESDAQSSFWSDLGTHAVLSAMFVSVVWLLVVVPMVLNKPGIAVEHRAMVNGARGFGAGALLMTAFSLIIAGIGGPFVLWSLVLEAGVIGGGAALVGSLLLRRERREGVREGLH